MNNLFTNVLKDKRNDFIHENATNYCVHRFCCWEDGSLPRKQNYYLALCNFLVNGKNKINSMIRYLSLSKFPILVNMIVNILCEIDGLWDMENIVLILFSFITFIIKGNIYSSLIIIRHYCWEISFHVIFHSTSMSFTLTFT